MPWTTSQNRTDNDKPAQQDGHCLSAAVAEQPIDKAANTFKTKPLLDVLDRGVFKTQLVANVACQT